MRIVRHFLVIPAQAGIQFVFLGELANPKIKERVKWRATRENAMSVAGFMLDSRLRGNDGVWKGVTLDSRTSLFNGLFNNTEEGST